MEMSFNNKLQFEYSFHFYSVHLLIVFEVFENYFHYCGALSGEMTDFSTLI